MCFTEGEVDMIDFFIWILIGVIAGGFASFLIYGLRILDRFKCKHVWMWNRNIHGDEINARDGKRSEWFCMKCGIYKHKYSYVRLGVGEKMIYEDDELKKIE